jgi:hypothetical protein
MTASRYALYFCPKDVPDLWSFGSSVIGYDSATAQDLPFLMPDGLDEQDWRALTGEPRRYGFHATLKAPFRLNDGTDEAHLRAEVAALAALGSFIALIPARSPVALQDHVQQVVEAFEPFRAPLSDAEMARRLQSPLSPRQIELLQAYGYPYVAEQFRFHMTLTGPISDPVRRETIRAALAAQYAERTGDSPVTLGSLALLKQPDPASCFHIINHMKLRA